MMFQPHYSFKHMHPLPTIAALTSCSQAKLESSGAQGHRRYAEKEICLVEQDVCDPLSVQLFGCISTLVDEISR